MTSAEEHYRTLEIEPGASLKEIKEAYRDLASVWHPDRFTGNSRLQEKAQEKLKEINSSYEYLRAYASNQPRLTEIIIVPTTVQLNLGESQTFHLVGLDQNRNPINIDYIEWSATGGTISSDGCYLAEDDGCFFVTASVEILNHSACITVVRPSPEDTDRSLEDENSEREDQRSTPSETVSNHSNNEKPKSSGVVSFIRIALWSFWGVLLLTPSSKTQTYGLFIPLAVFCLSALILGLIHPSFTLSFGFRKTRRVVTILYLPPVLIYLFFPSSWIPLAIIETSIWVAADAKKIGIKKGQLGGGFFDRGRWEWFTLCLLFWTIAFPSYLIKRSVYIRQNKISSAGRV